MEGWSRRESRSYGESEHEANLAWDKLEKVREKMGKDLRTVTKVEEKINDISKRLKKPSKGKSIWKRKTPRQIFVKLKEMESKLIGIKNRFGLLISHWEIHGNRHVTNIDELRHKVNLIEVSAAQITKLLQTFDDDIGQSSTRQQFMDNPQFNNNSAPVILQFQGQEQQQFEAPDVEQFQALNINPTHNQTVINPNPHHVPEGDDLNFPKLYPPGEYDHICSNWDAPVLHFADDDDSMPAKMHRWFAETVESRASQPEPKFFDCRELCEDLALGHLKYHEGVDYVFVGFASILVPAFSTTYGDGLHLNFFARPKGAPSHSPAQLIFVEVANGSPQQVIRCVPLPHISYSHGDEDKPSSHTIYHPDNEDCPYCEHAKDGSLSKNFCLPPPLM